MCEIAKLIEDGGAVLGIEFGSTRIKGVLLNASYEVIASGDHEWENRLEDGIWTYSMEDTMAGLADCYAKLKQDVRDKYGVRLTKLKSVGISAMMHGYLAFDEKDALLVPFRTWRNTITEEASEKLTELLKYHIPQRWSIAHFYQAILNGEAHVKDVAFFTTLAGYVHYRLTGEKILGVGDASGMFPIDAATADYNAGMVQIFNEELERCGIHKNLKDLLPASVRAGEYAGVLTEEGAKLLDPAGDLEAGCPLCPPEGDAGTGMVATNSVAQRTGNVSAGTSIFSMVVLERPLSKVYPELDLVTTPMGDEVAMVHCNNCTSDLNAWVSMFAEFAELMGMEVSRGQLFEKLFTAALSGDPDCGGLLSYNYYSGEPVANIMDQAGRPMLVRTPESKFTLANLMRANIYSALGTLKMGNDILLKQEDVKIDKMLGHGGFFKTKGVGQRYLSAALHTPVTCMETAGEGGAYGAALLAAYLVRDDKAQLLDAWLSEKIFADAVSSTLSADAADVEGFEKFAARYERGLAVEKAAIENFD